MLLWPGHLHHVVAGIGNVLLLVIICGHYTVEHRGGLILAKIPMTVTVVTP